MGFHKKTGVLAENCTWAKATAPGGQTKDRDRDIIFLKTVLLTYLISRETVGSTTTHCGSRPDTRATPLNNRDPASPPHTPEVGGQEVGRREQQRPPRASGPTDSQSDTTETQSYKQARCQRDLHC